MSIQTPPKTSSLPRTLDQTLTRRNLHQGSAYYSTTCPTGRCNSSGTGTSHAPLDRAISPEASGSPALALSRTFATTLTLIDSPIQLALLSTTANPYTTTLGLMPDPVACLPDLRSSQLRGRRLAVMHHGLRHPPPRATAKAAAQHPLVSFLGALPSPSRP